MIRNYVSISDTHAGCLLGLCPPEGCARDEGGRYMPSTFQQRVWSWWREFFDVFVPHATQGEPYFLVHGGDAIDGVHHESVTQISNNLVDQERLAIRMLEPEVARCVKLGGRYVHIRGTEAHVGKSAQSEERIAAELGAVPMPGHGAPQHARYDLWAEIQNGNGTAVIHDLHHVGTTSSNAYEATAIFKELVEMYTEAARWGEEPPTVVVRHHRHRNLEVRMPIKGGDRQAIVIVTPGWQGKTPFAWKIAGARTATPQFGGVVIRVSDEGDVYTRSYVRTVGRSELVTQHRLLGLDGGTDGGNEQSADGTDRSGDGGRTGRGDGLERQARTKSAQAGNRRRAGKVRTSRS